MASIVIPIYKAHPSRNELKSFCQCYKVLGSHPIFVVTYKGLELNEYANAIHRNINCKYFEESFFSSVSAYNELMTSYSFYYAFRNYKYILIYQLDAWVFNDSLIDWCNRGYDYVGAPWFENFGSYEENSQLWKVGNGGFSLRRVDKFLSLTNPMTKIRSSKEVFQTFYKGFTTLPSCMLKCLGRKNNVAYYKNSYKYINEDVFFTINMSEYKRLRLKTPSAEDAAYFAFECSPRYLFKLTNHKLPFGCHAWEKYDLDFWHEFIHRNTEL